MVFDQISVDELNQEIIKLKKKGSNKKLNVFFPFHNIPVEFLEKIIDKDMVCFKSEYSNKKLSANDILNIENILDLFVQDIKNSNLSPYERYVAVYSMVKSFKEYKFYKDSEVEDQKCPEESRSVYLILFNDYCVCVGYTILLVSLLKRVGINSIDFSSTIGDSEETNHRKCCVNIIDPKYDINGYFINDITNDNSIEEDEFFKNMYIHLPITGILSFEDDDSELLDIFTCNKEQLEKILKENYYNYNKLKKLDPDFIEQFEKKNIKEFLEHKINNDELSDLDINDPQLLKKFHEKSFDLSEDLKDYIIDNDTTFLNELIKHFKSKDKNFIKPIKLYKAIIQVKNFINENDTTKKTTNKKIIQTIKDISDYRILYIYYLEKNMFNYFKKLLLFNNKNSKKNNDDSNKKNTL